MQSEYTSSNHCQVVAGSPTGRLTFEDVKSAFEKLEAAGVTVTTRRVHEELGWKGSRTTVVKHFSAIQRTRKSLESTDSPPLSAIVLRELAREIDKIVKERTSQLLSELADCRASLDLLVDENEAFRTSASDADSRLSALQNLLAEKTGVAEVLRTQSESLAQQLAAANTEAERARQALALAREHERLSDEKLLQLDALQQQTRKEVVDLRRNETELRNQLEVKMRTCIELQGQVDSGRQVESRLEQISARGEALQSELEKTRGLLASSEAHRSSLIERLKDVQDSLSRAEAMHQQLLLKLFHKSALNEDDLDKSS